jgi:hypothetical protein
MAWTTPPTFTSAPLTAAQLNILSADLNETAPAKASTAGQYFVATGTNLIAARTAVSTSVTTAETTTLTSLGDLPTGTVGPAATVTSGAQFLVLMNATVANNTSGVASSIGFEISGATTSAASQIYISLLTAAANQQATMGGVRMVIGATPGSNTVTMKYVVGAGTGTFSRRFLTVLPF